MKLTYQQHHSRVLWNKKQRCLQHAAALTEQLWPEDWTVCVSVLSHTHTKHTPSNFWSYSPQQSPNTISPNPPSVCQSRLQASSSTRQTSDKNTGCKLVWTKWRYRRVNLKTQSVLWKGPDSHIELSTLSHLQHTFCHCLTSSALQDVQCLTSPV